MRGFSNPTLSLLRLRLQSSLPFLPLNCTSPFFFPSSPHLSLLSSSPLHCTYPFFFTSKQHLPLLSSSPLRHQLCRDFAAALVTNHPSSPTPAPSALSSLSPSVSSNVISCHHISPLCARKQLPLHQPFTSTTPPHVGNI